MKIIPLIILMFYATHSKRLRKTVSNTKNQNTFRLIDNSKGITLPKFVILPNFKKINESYEIQYKSFRKSTTIISSSKWILSVYVDQNFFYNNQSNEPLHALCYLEFSIENISNEIGQNASCKVIVRINNFTATANCSLKIGRPPSTCSTHFELGDIILSKSPTSWASVSAELSFPSSPSVTSSINRPGFLFNSFKPVNWTVVQSDEKFGKFGLGLPITSVRTGSRFKIPFSITKIDRLNSAKILMEYNDCFSFNGLENLNSSRWEIENTFYQMDSRQTGFIRVTSLDKNYRVDEELYKERKWKEIGLLELIVNENPSKDACWIRAGISKIEVAQGSTKKYFDKNNFQGFQKAISVSMDLINLIMIVFPEPRTAPVKLYSDLDYSVAPISSHVYSYLLHKSGDFYFPQLIKNLTCYSKEFSRGISKNQCVPTRFTDSWVLPVEIEHWRTVVFNIFNVWKPESWKLYLSDTELNPISDWKVYRNKSCVFLYQSAVLKIATRLAYFNSFGIRTYLGATFKDAKPWVDVSKETDISSLITTKPSEVVSFSRNNRGSILVDVKSNQRTVISLVDRRNNLLADTEISVFSDHWASVVRFYGRCLSQLDLHESQSHPNGEGKFYNYNLKMRKLALGEKCRLYLGVVFNDNSEMLLEDVAPEDYRLEVDGMEFRNGDLVNFRQRMNIGLYGSPQCALASAVRTGTIDLSSDWIISRDAHIDIPGTPRPIVTTETITESPKTKKSSETFIEPRNSFSIAVYCIVGIVAMAVVILLLNCLIGLNVRRNSTAHMQRRLSKSGNFDRQNNIKTDYSSSQKPIQDHYPPLLPPPGPIVPPGKPIVDWAVSSESGIGLERSSLGSQQDQLGLSTFRISMANGSTHPSDSSSYIHRTSPFNDIILESNVPMYSVDSAPQPTDSQTCSNRPFWPRINSPYRGSNLDNYQDFRSPHDSTLSSESRKKLDIV